MKLEERIDKLSMFQKIVILLAAIILIFVGAFGYEIYADYQKQEKIKEEKVFVDKKETEISDFESKLKGLLIEENSSFLRKDVTYKKLSRIEKELDEIEREYNYYKLHEEAESLSFNGNVDFCRFYIAIFRKTLETQDAINTLFCQTVIEGSVVNSDIPIEEYLEPVSIVIAKEKYYLEDTNDNWQLAINALLLEVEEQLNHIETAKQAVAKMVEDDQVISTEEQDYHSAVTAVNQIKNEKVKTELADKLAKVKQKIDEG
jgi:CHASE3 domain sensor protein